MQFFTERIRQINRFLKAVKRANRKARKNEPMQDYYILVPRAGKTPPHVIKGTVPMSFNYTPKA